MGGGKGGESDRKAVRRIVRQMGEAERVRVRGEGGTWDLQVGGCGGM